jgi:Subtilase family
MATPKPTSRRRTTSRRSRGEATSFPDRIFALASPRSVGGISLFEAGGLADPLTVGNFESEPDLVQRAVYLLQDAGFEVLQATSIMINIAGSRSTYESAFQTTLVAEERETIKERGRVDLATFFDSPDTEVSGLISTANTRFEEILEGVAIEEPRYLMAPSPFPPAKGYWHLDVPGDVSLGCNADQAHRAGITGAGVRVAMVDSGWYRHPFFQQRGYRAAPVVLGPGTANPDHDEVGHGTGESANLFAVAPDIELVPVKAMLSGSLNTVLTNATAAFNAAVGVNPAVITNSWGFSIQNGPLSAAQQALAAAVAAAVAQGIVVVFSAGNGHWGFPGQHPDVISAGGVFLNPDGSLQASDYASGFDSNVYPGRRVPDLSGLVGMRPGASYIMLPVEPGDVLDSDLAGGTHLGRRAPGRRRRGPGQAGLPQPVTGGRQGHSHADRQGRDQRPQPPQLQPPGRARAGHRYRQRPAGRPQGRPGGQAALPVAACSACPAAPPAAPGAAHPAAVPCAAAAARPAHPTGLPRPAAAPGAAPAAAPARPAAAAPRTGQPHHPVPAGTGSRGRSRRVAQRGGRPAAGAAGDRLRRRPGALSPCPMIQGSAPW